MHCQPNTLLLLLGLLAPGLLAGCPGPSDPDAGPDVPARDAPAPVDAPLDVPLPVDAGSDTPIAMDTPSDSDGGTPLPAIVNPEPHVVPASAAGHDRYYGVVFAPDSSFYVAGVVADTTDASADFRVVVRHFGADGEPDAAFGTGGVFEQNLVVGGDGELARSIALDSVGRIVVAGTVDAEGAADPRDRDAFALRLLANGTLDASFAGDGVAILDFSTGVESGVAFVADVGWGLAIDAEDRVLVHGAEVRSGEVDLDWVVARLTEDGALDTGFAGDGTFSLDLMGGTAGPRHIRVLGDRIVACGFNRVTGPNPVQPVLFALTNAGALDPTFGTAGIFNQVIVGSGNVAEAYDVVVVGGRLVTAGYGRDDGPGDNDFLSLGLTLAGALDSTYGTGGASIVAGFDFVDNGRKLVALPDGRTVHVGAIRTASSEAEGAIVVFNATGALDTTFDTDGVLLVDSSAGAADHLWGIDLDPRGERVAVVGIGGTNPSTDDDGLVYLFEVP